MLPQQFKNACKSLLARFGYEIRSLSRSDPDDVDFAAARTVEEAQYYAQWAAPCPLLGPCLGHPDFQPIYAGAELYTMV